MEYGDQLRLTLPVDILDEFGLIIEETPVIQPFEDAIGEAARQFVSMKCHLDLLAHRRGGETLLREILGDHYTYGTVGTFCYADCVLPFFHSARKLVGQQTEYKALISPHIVVGESWNWTPADKTTSQQNDIIRASFAGLLDVRSSSTASYFYIPRLNVALASEGKNRVALFREWDLPIPAVVQDIPYPKAERIRLFRIPEGAFAVLDDRYLQRLQSPETTESILAPYGVATESRWPEEYPSLPRVIEALSNPFSPWRTFKEVDMRPIKDRQRADEQIVRASLMDFDNPLRPSCGTILSLGFLAFSFFFLGVELEGLTVLRTISFVLFATLAGILALTFTPLFRCQVQQLEPSLYQKRRMEFIDLFQREWRNQV
jgi:hypothetical protein